nr:collagen alpha-1(III) chain-like [Saimiri boliviensis boliviensis]
MLFWGTAPLPPFEVSKVRSSSQPGADTDPFCGQLQGGPGPCRGGGHPSPKCGCPSSPGSGRRGLREAPPPCGVPSGDRVPQSQGGLEDGDAEPPPLPSQAPGREAASLPAPPPHGYPPARGRAHSPSAPRFPAAQPLRVPWPHTLAPAPAHSGPSAPPASLGSQAAAARAGHGPRDQPAESFLRGKRRDGTGRDGAGRAGRRGGKGPGEEGERSGQPGGGRARPAGRPSPTGNRRGRPRLGPAPGPLTTTVRLELCLRARARGLNPGQVLSLTPPNNPATWYDYPHFADKINGVMERLNDFTKPSEFEPTAL